MPTAVIQGEIHSSSKDKEALRQRRTEETDAIFVEGMPPEIGLKKSLKYLFFVMGFLQYLVFHYRIWRLYDFSEVEDVEVHKETDAYLHEIWDNLTDEAGSLVKIASWFCAGSIIVALIVTFGEEGLLMQALGVSLLVLMPMVFFMLCLVAASTVSTTSLEFRDSQMTHYIDDISEEEGYSHVLVLCGDRHVVGMESHLEELGWNVETHRSNRLRARILRALLE